MDNSCLCIFIQCQKANIKRINLKRRSFFKNMALVPLSLSVQGNASPHIEYEPENRLEYASILFSFPFEWAGTEHGKFIYRRTLQVISEIEHSETMIHCGDGAHLYDGEIDRLLCSLDFNRTDEIWYPSVAFKHKKQMLELPDISLIVTMQHPRLTLLTHKESFSVDFDGIHNLSGFPPWKLSELTIEITGDLSYHDFDRWEKRFDLRTFQAGQSL